MSLTFLITALVVVAIPGTGALLTIGAGLARGRRASLVTAFGCTLGIVPHLLAAITGTAALLRASGLAFEILKGVGVAYLLIMAVRTWRDHSPLVAADQPTRSPARTVLSSALSNLLNPKLTLFFFAFLPQFVPSHGSGQVPVMLELGGVFMLMTFVVFAGYGLLAAAVRDRVTSRPRPHRRVPRHPEAADRRPHPAGVRPVLRRPLGQAGHRHPLSGHPGHRHPLSRRVESSDAGATGGAPMTGPDPSTSQGNPAQLHASGLVFQKFANGVNGMAESEVLQAPGGAGSWAAQADDANLGASTSDFQKNLGKVSDQFLQFLISAEPQFADAAIDLFDCAGDFATADNQIPPGATCAGTNSNGITVYTEDGINGRDVWWKDKEGNVNHVFHDDGISMPAPTPPGGNPAQPTPTPTATPGPAPTPTQTPSPSPSGGQS